MPFGLEGPGLTAALDSAQAATVELARDQVITYTVQPGDTVVAIARKFGLTPHTVFWSNAEAMQDDPRRLSVGTVLTILPLNGVYHVATADETLPELAEEFAVVTETLYNRWNPLLEGQALTAGMALVIPGGQGGAVPWKEAATSIGDSGNAGNVGGSGLCGGELQGVPGRGSFDWPTDGRKISGWYFHDAWNPTHGGLDIQLKTGDPVYAADGGTISFAGWWTNGGYGNLVVVDHLNGWTTWYGHFSQVDVVCAQQVSAGDVIGLGGSTGWSTGPHLHFEMRLQGVPQDPLIYLP